MLLVSQKHKLSLLTVLGILFCVISSNLIAKVNPASGGIEGFISYQLPKYEKPVLIASALAKPIYYTTHDWVSSKGSISNLVKELYGVRTIPDFNQNQDIVVGISLINGGQDTDTSSPMTNGLSELFLNSSSTSITQSLHGSTTDSNHITTTTNMAANVDQNVEELSDDYEASNQFFGSSSGFIPEELRLLIFSYLTPEELARSAAVSRDWCRIVNDNILWKMRTRHDFDKETIDRVIKKQTSKDAGVAVAWKEIYGLCYKIKCYIGAIRSADDFDQVRRIFNLAQDSGLVNANTYAAYIDALEDMAEDFDEIQRALKLAQDSGLVNVDLYVNYIDAAAMEYEFDEAKRGLELAQDSGLISANTYAAYIFAASMPYDFPRAQSGLKLAQDDVLVNANVYANYIDVAGRTHHFSEVQRIFKLAQESGLVNPAVYANCISIYGFDIINADHFEVTPEYGADDENNFREARRIFNLAVANRVTDINVYSNYLNLVCAFNINDSDEQLRVIELAIDDDLSADNIDLLRRIGAGLDR